MPGHTQTAEMKKPGNPGFFYSDDRLDAGNRLS